MATLFHARQSHWDARPLDRDQLLTSEECGQNGWQVVPLNGSPGYLLMLGPGIVARVNGEPVGTVVVLKHCDEVRIDGQCWCYSEHSRPQITVFHAEPGRRPPKCALCSVLLREGDMVVVCPGCGRIYHQIDAAPDREAKQCWTYEPQCRYCQHPTDLSGSGGWQPELDAEVGHAS